MALLKTREGFFILLDRGLKLFNVLRSPFSKGSLCLPIPLFALLRRCIYLRHVRSSAATLSQSYQQLTGFLPPLRFCGCAGVGSCDVSSPGGGPSCSGVDSTELGVRSAGAAGAGSILLSAAISSAAVVLLSPICRYPRLSSTLPPARLES